MNMRTTMIAAALALAAGAASAEMWTLDGANSRIGFGSVKSDVIGEGHSFSGLSGSVGEDGKVDLTLDLASLNTNIDIRNERIQEHVFKMAPDAQLLAEVDMEAMEGLAVGATMESLVEGTLMFLGEEVYVDLPVVAARLSEDNVLIMSDGITYISTEELDINAGVDKLMELAGLESIDRAVPVTVRLMFTAGDSSS
ncbi:MAG: YceI family protein [Rhodobacteraceae bacterium]|nr:YceI family protein [Paracoccaceae bacterium]